MDYPYAEVGARIWQIRKARGWTREKLAEMADISVQFLADIERGAKNMTVTTLRKLCAALSVSTDFIVNDTAPAAEEEALWLELYRALPQEARPYAAEIVRTFARSCQRKS